MFSTKAEYGVRVMAHLARRDGEGPISLSSIADAEGLPLAYLEHLVQRLRRAELVLSHRGAHGGYTLARTAEDITMAELVMALEGEIAPIECITADPERGLVCVREGDPGHDPCPTKLLWTRVQGSIVRTLTEMTLADLARPAGARKPAPGRRTKSPEQPLRGRAEDPARHTRSGEAGRRTGQSKRGARDLAEVTT